MNAIESVRAAQEIGRRLARAPDSTKFRDSVRLNAVFIEGFDDLRCDCVVAASRAESRIGAFIISECITEPVCMFRRRRRLHRSGHQFFSPFSAATSSSVTKRASMGIPL